MSKRVFQTDMCTYLYIIVYAQLVIYSVYTKTGTEINWRRVPGIYGSRMHKLNSQAQRNTAGIPGFTTLSRVHTIALFNC